MKTDRRQFLRAASLLPVLAAAACAGPFGTFGIEDGVRRLLTLSSQRAFGRLLQRGGFYDDQLTRILPPASGDGGSGDVLGAILRTGAVRNQIALALNDIAVDAAERAAPIVVYSIRNMSIADAVSVLRGGPSAATAMLQREVGNGLVEAMFPEFSAGFNSDAGEILSAALRARTGVDYQRLARTGAELASASIFRAIGREEAAIRADPRATRDPAIIALFSLPQ